MGVGEIGDEAPGGDFPNQKHGEGTEEERSKAQQPICRLADGWGAHRWSIRRGRAPRTLVLVRV